MPAASPATTSWLLAGPSPVSVAGWAPVGMRNESGTASQILPHAVVVWEGRLGAMVMSGTTAVPAAPGLADAAPGDPLDAPCEHAASTSTANAARVARRLIAPIVEREMKGPRRPQ